MKDYAEKKKPPPPPPQPPPPSPHHVSWESPTSERSCCGFGITRVGHHKSGSQAQGNAFAGFHGDLIKLISLGREVKEEGLCLFSRLSFQDYFPWVILWLDMSLLIRQYNHDMVFHFQIWTQMTLHARTRRPSCSCKARGNWRHEKSWDENCNWGRLSNLKMAEIASCWVAVSLHFDADAFWCRKPQQSKLFNGFHLSLETTVRFPNFRPVRPTYASWVRITPLRPSLNIFCNKKT